MKKLSLVLIALFFSPLSVQAETVFDHAESFQIAKAVKMGRQTSTSSPFHNNDILRDDDDDNGSKGSSITPFQKQQIRCPTGQYYDKDDRECLDVCKKVYCYWKEYKTVASGDTCYCTRK